ncbi:GntR family transcriptional regulator [Halomonas denitrificans]|uniref:GntR family transcriptional regulator n=1 Tax=Halomonas TaxID=2745 RepID=UPI001A8D3C63|nr:MULTISPECIES: GntR family transcriptional regulator [Halomonas]MED5295287.1 GntR family transcriptional regulator [Pseudomonadota bacterium]MBN8411568.1 GntR family transcriptional regulator [Halomonas litopenaei]MBY5923919.1 GntR family transcriptional regulator [Halomonas sp. DP4Y7-2]MBY5928070.1 GntR family transcriptional regulator [Halomonas sp. DP8Y7-3]MBY5967383.1 GntR family transcriptional regulator [Halomonas denitrificans]
MSNAWQQEVMAEIKSGGRISDGDIVRQVRRAVLTQRLPPGTRLPEVTLGDVFGVSRSVVRKALTRLASEHVVDQRPNQVARVRAPDVDETRQTFAARRLVEGEVAALTAGTLEAPALVQLEDRIDREREAFLASDEPTRIEHSLAIHHLLAEHSPNRVLGAMLTDLILRTSIVIALYKRQGVGSCYLEGDHTRLLSHLREGDGEACRRDVELHLDSLQSLLDLGPRDSRIDLRSILAGDA